ncbi:MAG: biotin/lipoyl-binding protein, partial [Burkholderiaceae bacterium]|nr:biotin/lipoyl-binding protein [Burkholderiaceae bacterium]
MKFTTVATLCAGTWLASLAGSEVYAQAAVPTKAPAKIAAPAVATTTVSVPARSLARLAALGCLIEASTIVDVGASVIGVIDDIAVERGDVVTKGQVLAQLEANVERAAVSLAQTKVRNKADIQSARSQKDYAIKKAQRTAELTERKFVSHQALEQAKTEAAMADMKLAQTLEQRTLAEQELQLA